MDANEKRGLETQLMKMGLAGLQEGGAASPELIQQIAGIINSWQSTPNRQGEWIDRHKFLRDLLAECDQSERGAMYSAIIPHLNFLPLPLASYETMMTERMGKLISKGAARAEGKAPKPIEIGSKKYVQAPDWAATHAIMTLHCQRCFKKKRFLADTPAGAMIAARKAGWARFPHKETCPNCIKKLTASGKVLVN